MGNSSAFTPSRYLPVCKLGLPVYFESNTGAASQSICKYLPSRKHQYVEVVQHRYLQDEETTVYVCDLVFVFTTNQRAVHRRKANDAVESRRRGRTRCGKPAMQETSLFDTSEDCQTVLMLTALQIAGMHPEAGSRACNVYMIMNMCCVTVLDKVCWIRHELVRRQTSDRNHLEISRKPCHPCS